jgi:hypothetical protein
MSMTPSAFIEDGQYVPGYIAAVPRRSPEVRFEYRPMLQKDINAAIRRVQEVLDRGDDEDLAIAEVIVARVRKWSLGAITIDRVRSLQPATFQRMYHIISGQGISDPDPQADETERQQEAELAKAAAESGRTVGEERAEQNAKN